VWFTLDIGSFRVLRGLASSFVQQCQNRYLSLFLLCPFYYVALSCHQLSFLLVLPSVLLSILNGPPLMRRSGCTWIRPLACGSCVGTTLCVITPSPPSPKTLQLPLLAHRCRGRFHGACAVRMPHPHSQHHLSTTYITSRFSCASCYRSDLKFDPRLSFRPFPTLVTILGQPPPSYPLPAHTPIVLVLSQFPSQAQSTAPHMTEHRSVG